MFLFVGLALTAVHAQAQESLAKCEESEADACAVAVRSNLPPTKLSEAYTFWADTFPDQWGNTTEPMKLLRKISKISLPRSFRAVSLRCRFDSLIYLVLYNCSKNSLNDDPMGSATAHSIPTKGTWTIGQSGNRVSNP